MMIVTKRLAVWICFIVVMLGSACVRHSPPAQPPSVLVEAVPTAGPPEEKGDDVARHLQGRYNESRQDCGGKTSPAFVCSGILLRSTTWGTGYHSWMPNPATASWGVTFSWLRQDANFDDSGATANGFIVYPRSYADPRGFEKLYVRCGYPQDAKSTGPDRCYVKWAICQDMVPPITTSVAWMKVFTKDTDQCAFGVDRNRQDKAAIWMQVVGVRHGRQVNKRDEIIVDSWDTISDEKWMPIEAFFYRTNPDPGMPNALQSAQKDQEEFKKVTKRWVPVIRWTPSANVIGGAKFEYRIADQKVLPGPETGADVARHLQSRYADPAKQCGSATAPAFVCAGILLRSTNYSAGYHSWLPNPGSAPWGVSASWLRLDSDFVGNYPSGNGFIIYPAKYIDSSVYDSIEVRCGYPRDAGTGGPDRCRTICQKLPNPITTAAQHQAAYGGRYGCPFGVEKGTANSADAWMQVAIIRKNVGLEGSTAYNEIILAAWSQTIGARMPVEAFFYRSNTPASLASARLDQQDFKNATGRWVPIIKWTVSAAGAPGTASFSFDPNDQTVQQ